MEIFFNTDNNIQGSESLIEKYQPEIESKFQRYADYLTRVEVFMADENGKKSGTEDKRCTIETRLKGKTPDAVTHYADTLAHALNGAIDKARNLLDRQVGQLKAH